MRRYSSALLAFLFALLSLDSSPSFAVKLTDGPQTSPALIGFEPLLATAAPNLKSLPLSLVHEHQRVFNLSDGTKVPGLFFKGKTSKVLFIANFGIFSNEYARAISFFVNALVLPGILQGDIFIVDSTTSGPFYSVNHELGLGGYEEGRIIVELAQQLKTQTIYLFGVSLGGNAVIQALIEDQRENLHLFKGAITFSAVLDEAQSTQTLLSSYGYPLDMRSFQGALFNHRARFIVNSLFKGTNRTLSGAFEGDEPVTLKGAGGFYYRSFTRRLKHLGSQPSSWNPAVSTTSVEAYVQTSSDLLHQVRGLHVPLLVVHAKNDPVVPYSQFRAFETEQLQNPNVLTLGTHFGGHWGFFDTYGADWVMALTSRLESTASLPNTP